MVEHLVNQLPLQKLLDNFVDSKKETFKNNRRGNYQENFGVASGHSFQRRYPIDKPKPVLR